jgi:hypothetical protein
VYLPHIGFTWLNAECGDHRLVESSRRTSNSDPGMLCDDTVGFVDFSAFIVLIHKELRIQCIVAVA